MLGRNKLGAEASSFVGLHYLHIISRPMLTTDPLIFVFNSGWVAPTGQSFFRRQKTNPRQAKLRKSTQPRRLLPLVLAAAAVGANAAAAVAAATAATGGAFRPAKTSREGRGEPGGPTQLSRCGLEATACFDDAECGGWLAMVMGWAAGKTAELAGYGGVDDGRGGDGGDLDGDWMFEAGPPATRCEKVGATVCGWFTDAVAQQELGEEEEKEGGLDVSRRTDNRVVRALLACRVRTAGCEPDDAPCITPDSQRRWGGSNDSNNASRVPRSLLTDVERGGGASRITCCSSDSSSC